jgi:hypothetical protein
MNRRVRAAAVLVAGLPFAVLAANAGAQAGAEPTRAWTRSIGVAQGTLEIFQPQIESFEGDRLAARAADARVRARQEDGPLSAVTWPRYRAPARFPRSRLQEGSGR